MIQQMPFQDNQERALFETMVKALSIQYNQNMHL